MDSYLTSFFVLSYFKLYKILRLNQQHHYYQLILIQPFLFKSINIYMFDNLNKKINLENLNKIKQQNSKSRYQLEFPQSDNGRGYNNMREDSQLDQLQVELEDREQNFRKINEQQQADEQNFLRRDNTIPPTMLRKVQNQLQLMKQQLKIEKNSHERQLQYQKQLYKRRQEWIQMQSSKLKLLLKKYKSEQSQIKQLKNDMHKYQQIKQTLQSRIQNTQTQNRNLRALITKLQKQKTKRQQKETKQLLIQGNQKQKINKLTIKITQIQEDLEYEKRQNQDKKKTINKMNFQIQRIKESMRNKDKQYEDLSFRRQESYCKRQQQLQQQIMSLKKRNQYLEETFIDKMSEITRLQAHLLSNTSHSQHQSMSAGAKNSRNAEQTINLHEQSPIRPVPQTNYSERKPSIKNPKKPTLENKQDNPENENKKPKGVHDGQCQCCYKKIQKYKSKLDQANRKIVELIQQKMECIRRSSSKEKSGNLNTTANGLRTCYNRARITSWNGRLL